jgi:serine/threonine protein kinase
MRALSEDRHPGIIEFIECYEDQANFTIVMEYIEGGSL